MCADHRVEFAVIGAGPAGSAVAAGLARAGRDVCLLERDAFPRDKLCGEFLSGDASKWLEHFGARDIVRAIEPAAIHRAMFTSAGGGRAELPLPLPGLGVSRRRLDAALFAHAVDCGANGRTKVEVESVARDGDGFVVAVRGASGVERIQAMHVIGAHGRRARIDRSLGRPFIDHRHPYVALKRHHTGGSGLEGRVEIHTFPGGYCGMSHVEGGTVNVCMLLEESLVRSIGGAQWDAVIADIRLRNPALNDRLATLVATDEPVAVAQIPFGDKAQAKDGVLFVGDAAGMIAPLAGDGQAMALESAVMLVELLLTGPADLSAAWTAAWRRRFKTRMRLGRGLQRGLLGPRSADWLVRTIGGVPGLGRALVALTRS